MKRYLILTVATLLSLTGCQRNSDKPNIELIQDMMVSPAVKAQDEDPNSMKTPPEGTIPQGHEPYKFGSAEEAALKLKNPFPADLQSQLRGQKMFQTYCMVCHGATGNGKGPVAAKWPAAIPNFYTQRVRDWKDGHLYHLITRGRGLMGSYAYQIHPEDRWHIINYIRQLQSQTKVMNDDGTFAQ